MAPPSRGPSRRAGAGAARRRPMPAAVLAVALLPPAAAPWPAADAAFSAWRAEHGKEYASAAEAAKRMESFAETLLSSAAAARRNPHARFSPGRWADLTQEERRAKLQKPAPQGAPPAPLPRFTPQPMSRFQQVNDTFDWERAGAVSAVKDQHLDHHYGTCWSFATTGVMEGQRVVSSHLPLVNLTPQEPVDCCTNCGGYPGATLSWYLQIGGQDTQDSYGPYVGKKGQCKRGSATVGETITATHEVGAEADFMAAVQGGPMHVSIDAGPIENYQSGVITDSPCTGKSDPGNHDVLLVGAGVDENGIKYWRIKNSWGDWFGEKGYFRVVRDQGAICLGVKSHFGAPGHVAVGRKP